MSIHDRFESTVDVADVESTNRKSMTMNSKTGSAIKESTSGPLPIFKPKPGVGDTIEGMHPSDAIWIKSLEMMNMAIEAGDVASAVAALNLQWRIHLDRRSRREARPSKAAG